MYRRRFLTLSGGVVTALAGCTGTDSTSQDTTEGNPESTTEADEPTTATTTEPETATRTTTESRTRSGEDTTDSATTTEAAYTVRIAFDGSWQGSITTDGTSKSIDGTGTANYTISGDPTVVAVNAQKQSDGDGELTVQILEDGEVVGEQSTTASYGVAQATSQGGSDIFGDSETTAASEDTFTFKVIYDGQWQGSLTTGGSTRSIDGSGTREISVDGSPDVISGNAQKQDDSDSKLTVQVLQNGDVVKEASTTAEYGLAQVSYTSY